MRVNKYAWLLFAVGCVVFALALAVWQLQNQLVFGFDQARDAFEAHAIWHDQDLKILGPSTDIPGVFHGVLWYYFLAFVYFLGRTVENTALISLFIFFLSAPLLGVLTQKLFKNPRVTFLAVSLYVLSPLFQVFSRWLSNPSLALLVTPLLLFGLWNCLTKPTNKAAVVCGLLFGTLIQTNFAYGLQLLVIPIYFWQFHQRPKIAQVVAFLVGLLVTTSSFFLAEYKFGGQGLAGLMAFFLKGGASPNASAALLSVFDRVIEMVSLVVLPWPKLAVIIFIAYLFTVVRKNKIVSDRPAIRFLAIWLFGFVIMQVVSSAVTGSAHILAAYVFPLVILFAYALSKAPAVWLLPIFAAQILSVLNWTKVNYSPLSVQRGMFFSQEKKVIDYTFGESQGKSFIINTVTNPLSVNTTWAYLYEFYGQPKYGRLPFWGGKDQKGLLGALPAKPFGEDLRFLIIEDLAGIPEFYMSKAVYEEDKVSDLVEEKEFGSIRVQKRVFHPAKGTVALPPELINVSPNLLN